ncbi:MAG: undecaprenyl-diphosphate phosphatase [Rikenellaceae bacterium]
MTIFESITLGAVQGITEFLPVSSSGHLQLAKELMGVTLTDNLTFDVALHAGTVCSTILILWSEIWDIVKGFFNFSKLNEAHRFVIKIVISMIPVAIVGFTCKSYIERILNSQQNILVVGVMLLLTALLLLFAHRTPVEKGAGKAITYRDAFIIGLSQAAAVMPGLSRSGTTIATGIMLGRDRAAVAQFSFIMVLAPIIGNTLLDLIKGGGAIEIAGVSSTAIAAGFISSFIVGAAACKAMIEIVKRRKLIYFAIYCATAGVISITAYILR